MIEQEGAQPSGRLASAAAGLQQAERFHRLQADPAHRWLRAVVLETCAALRVRPQARRLVSAFGWFRPWTAFLESK